MKFKVLYYEGIVMKHQIFYTIEDVKNFIKNKVDVTILKYDDVLGYYRLYQID